MDIDKSKINLTDEQNKILQSVYNYNDIAEITDEDYKVIMNSFKTPESFVVLRKVLGILTRQELGLIYPLPDNNLQVEVSDSEYKFNHQLQIRVDESIRQSLANMYLILKTKFTAEQKVIFEKLNIKKTKEKEKQKEIDKTQADNNRGVGALV